MKHFTDGQTHALDSLEPCIVAAWADLTDGVREGISLAYEHVDGVSAV